MAHLGLGVQHRLSLQAQIDDGAIWSAIDDAATRGVPADELMNSYNRGGLAPAGARMKTARARETMVVPMGFRYPGAAAASRGATTGPYGVMKTGFTGTSASGRGTKRRAPAAPRAPKLPRSASLAMPKQTVRAPHIRGSAAKYLKAASSPPEVSLRSALGLKSSFDNSDSDDEDEERRARKRPKKILKLSRAETRQKKQPAEDLGLPKLVAYAVIDREEKELEAKGVNVMTLIKPLSSISSMVSKGRPAADWKPLGNVIVNQDALQKGNLSLRSAKNRVLMNVKQMPVSDRFGRGVIEMIGSGKKKAPEGLSRTERVKWKWLLAKARISGKTVHQVNQKALYKLQIMVGEIKAGNNNKELLTDAINLAGHLAQQGALSRDEYTKKIEPFLQSQS